MPWCFHVVESKHEIQNPTSADRIRLLGNRIGLKSGSRVLDVGSGRGGPAVLLAQTFGCHITCVEQSGEFHAAARGRVNEAGVERSLTSFTPKLSDSLSKAPITTALFV